MKRPILLPLTLAMIALILVVPNCNAFLHEGNMLLAASQIVQLCHDAARTKACPGDSELPADPWGDRYTCFTDGAGRLAVRTTRQRSTGLVEVCVVEPLGPRAWSCECDTLDRKFR